MSIGQKLEQVADLVYEKGYTKGGLDASPQETVSGGIVAITDISPIEHNVAVKASSKNLIPYPYINTTQTKNGIKYTDNKDGTVTINGSNPSESTFFYFASFVIQPGSYLLSGCPENGSFYKYYLYIYEVETKTYYRDTGKGVAYTTDTEKNIKIYMTVQANITMENQVVKPMLRDASISNNTYTPYVPDVSAATVKTLGKNILPYPYGSKTQTKNGVEFIINEDGTVNVNGTATDYITFILKQNIQLKKGSIYTLSGCPSGGSTTTYSLNIQDMSYKQGEFDIGKGRTFTTEYEKYYVWITIRSGVTVDNLVFKPMLEADSTATPHEPYKEPTNYPIAADGTVEGVTSIYPNMTITTDTDGVIIEANYYQDGKKVKENLIDMILSLGGVINE